MLANQSLISGSPAPAGIVPVSCVSISHRPGFPRTRGDSPGQLSKYKKALKVPPHPRG